MIGELDMAPYDTPRSFLVLWNAVMMTLRALHHNSIVTDAINCNTIFWIANILAIIGNCTKLKFNVLANCNV